MNGLAEYLQQRLADSGFAAHRIEPLPAVAGVDRVIAAYGPEPHLAVYAGLRHGGQSLRIGFAAKDRWMNEEVEDAVESNGGDMTEFIEDGMEADDELEFKTQHFHEAGWFHFASDLMKPAAFFATEEGRELAWLYLEGYGKAVLPVLAKAGKEE
ncbi:MAG: hypothetical protein SF028_12850 [Candidatus Sumerlaeia bacterium]|nr:hypothetical protein [Candidatus Sumerlaeia bacterium]